MVLNRKTQDHITKIQLQLQFQSKYKTLELLKCAFVSQGKTVRATQKKLIIENGSKINLFPMFHTQPTTSDIVSCVKSTTKDAKTYIAAGNFTPDVVAFARSLDREIVLLGT